MKVDQDILPRITRHLICYSSSTSNIGLLNGKMGIVIFFFLYAKYTKKKFYEDFAEELIDDVYSDIHQNITRDFKDGLTGIAWGIEFLIQNGFVYGDSNKVLEDLDKQILELDVRKISDISLETGLKGIAYYVTSRCNNKKNKTIIISFEYIFDLINALEINIDKDEECMSLIKNLMSIIHKENLPLTDNLLNRLSNQVKYKDHNIFKDGRALGILNNGYTGIGLKILNEITQ